MNTLLRSKAFFLFASISLSLFSTANPVVAQTENELLNVFSGNWTVFDNRFSEDDTPCRLSLAKDLASEESMEWRKTDISANCKAPLQNSVVWRISDGMIFLRSEDGSELAQLGGDPNRLTGDFLAPPGAIVFERNEGSGAKSMLVAAITKHKCYYIGYQSVCAEADATASPDLADGEAEVSVLVTLNVRSQPRRTAPLIGTVPKDSNVIVDLCLSTSDGIWCRADFGGKFGWMAKSAMRQQEWPAITFVNTKD